MGRINLVANKMQTENSQHIILEDYKDATSELVAEAEALGMSVDSYLSLLDLKGITY